MFVLQTITNAASIDLRTTFYNCEIRKLYYSNFDKQQNYILFKRHTGSLTSIHLL